LAIADDAEEFDVAILMILAKDNRGNAGNKVSSNIICSSNSEESSSINKSASVSASSSSSCSSNRRESSSSSNSSSNNGDSLVLVAPRRVDILKEDGAFALSMRNANPDFDDPRSGDEWVAEESVDEIVDESSEERSDESVEEERDVDFEFAESLAPADERSDESESLNELGVEEVRE